MEHYFSLIDYTLFISMLVLSAAIGVYYGFFKPQASATEYLLGGKRMKMWPIALSLISSVMSGVPLLLFPTEIYYYGVQFALCVFLFGFITSVTYYVYIPVFYKIQVTSTYEYFKLRFDNRLRTLASIFYAISMVLYLPLVIYVPALALSQVTGLNSHVITPIVCGVCIFYTTLGGLKAVVWTDALQFLVMIGSMVTVAILGVYAIGGFGFIVQKMTERGRLFVDFDLDLTLRDTFWTSTIGNFFIISGMVCVNQSTVQKCMSLSSFKEIRSALIIFAIGNTVLLTFIFLCGMAMFARYYDCDPVAQGNVEKRDQIFPYYIMDVGRNIPGLPGLFVSGILSAALSTLSAAMNCLAATIYEDFIKPFMSKDVPDKKVSIILKALVLFIGIVCTSLVYVVEHLGSLFALVTSFMSIATAPLLGLFSVGMLIPMVNSKGALCGAVSSLIIMSWTLIGNQFHRNKFPYQTLNVSIDGCLEISNNTLWKSPNSEFESGFFLYRISHFYYPAMSVTIVIVVSVIVSWFTKDEDAVVDKDLLSPVIHSLLSDERAEKEKKYYTVDKALNIVEKL